MAAVPPYLVSTLVMGLLGLGVLVLVVRGRRWRHYTPMAAYAMDAGDGAPRSGLARVAGSTNTWTLAYILLVLGVLGGAIVALTGVLSQMGMIVAFAAMVVAYLVAGVYVAMRGNGRPTAQAVAGSAVTLGFLFIAAISVKLILGL